MRQDCFHCWPYPARLQNESFFCRVSTVLRTFDCLLYRISPAHQTTSYFGCLKYPVLLVLVRLLLFARFLCRTYFACLEFALVFCRKYPVLLLPVCFLFFVYPAAVLCCPDFHASSPGISVHTANPFVRRPAFFRGVSFQTAPADAACFWEAAYLFRKFSFPDTPF